MGSELSKIEGVITDIQRFSVHDGIGIRTLVFIKGCPLSCRWCHNPETNSPGKQLMLYRERCIGCWECVTICPKGCVAQDGTVDRGICDVCGKCAAVCCTGSKRVCGETVTAGEIIERVLKDQVFFKRSGGGITLSGGEPTASPQFTTALLMLSREQGLNTAMETCGFCEEEIFRDISKLCDMILFDIKHTDPEKHIDGTGVDNKVILKNLRNAAAYSRVVVRFPMIPGYNDDYENLVNTAKIAKSAEALEIHVLPFHQLGEEKWRSLDKGYSYAGKKPPDASNIKRAAEILGSFGCQVNVSGYGEYRL